MTENILVHNSGVGFAPDIGRIIDTAGRNTGRQGHRNTANNVNLFYETNSEKIKINVFEIFGPFTILFWADFSLSKTLALLRTTSYMGF